MARINILIEDTFDGKVKVVATPNFETMVKMDISGEMLTSAHGYDFKALNAIRAESKALAPTKILIPKLIR
jgi:hypothetical protein